MARGVPWQPWEDRIVRETIAAGGTYVEAAGKLDRPVKSVGDRGRILGVNPRKRELRTPTPEEVETLRVLWDDLSLMVMEICTEMQVSYPVLRRWTRDLNFPRRKHVPASGDRTVPKPYIDPDKPGVLEQLYRGREYG